MQTFLCGCTSCLHENDENDNLKTTTWKRISKRKLSKTTTRKRQLSTCKCQKLKTRAQRRHGSLLLKPCSLPRRSITAQLRRRSTQTLFFWQQELSQKFFLRMHVWNTCANTITTPVGGDCRPVVITLFHCLRSCVNTTKTVIKTQTNVCGFVEALSCKRGPRWLKFKKTPRQRRSKAPPWESPSWFATSNKRFRRL